MLHFSGTVFCILIWHVLHSLLEDSSYEIAEIDAEGVANKEYNFVSLGEILLFFGHVVIINNVNRYAIIYYI